MSGIVICDRNMGNFIDINSKNIREMISVSVSPVIFVLRSSNYKRYKNLVQYCVSHNKSVGICIYGSKNEVNHGLEVNEWIKDNSRVLLIYFEDISYPSVYASCSLCTKILNKYIKSRQALDISISYEKGLILSNF